MDLRSYQRDEMNTPEVQAWFKAVRQGLPPPLPGILIQSPTGTGKTAMFCVATEKLFRWGKRVYIFVHKKKILRQTIKTLHRVGISCGVVESGRPMTRNLVQVGMIKTFKNRLHQLPKPDAMIFDEAHHVVEQNEWGLVIRFWNTTPILGFSATPARLSGEGLGRKSGGCFDFLVVGQQLRWHVEEGWLARPRHYGPPSIFGNINITRGDFDTGEQSDKLDVATPAGRQIVGDVITHYRKHLDGAPTLVACASLKNAVEVAAEFVAAGYRARAVWGGMHEEEFDDIIAGLEDGRVQLVMFCDLIGEGVDVPMVVGLIILRRTMSLSLFLQWIGRVLRPIWAEGFDLETKEGRKAAQLAGPKPFAVILDHAGNSHGHALSDRQWSLAASRRKKGEKGPVTWTCPECDAVWPGTPKKCPDCGYVVKEAPQRVSKPIEVIAGELVEAGVPEEEAEGLAAFLKRTEGLTPGARVRAVWAKAYELQEQGDNGKATMEKLVEAIGYKKNYTAKVWSVINKKKEMAANE